MLCHFERITFLFRGRLGLWFRVVAEPFQGWMAFRRLAELGLAQFNDGEWELTAAGQKILPLCIDGEEPKLD